MSKILGRVTPLWKGTYSGSVQYELNDIVVYNGSVYWHRGKSASTGTVPTNTTVWALAMDASVIPQMVTDATNAKNTAVSAKTAAESARAEAVTAKNTAVSAKTAAESAAVDAQAAVTELWYQGVDLTVKFASEINADFGGNPWAWIQARIQAADYRGIHINDYIPWVSTDGKAVKSCVAGIDTYYKFGDASVPHHIDFISRNLWYESHVMNKVNYNNGITKTDGTAVEYPWLASDLYHWLNSLAGEVPNGTDVGGNPVAVDYTGTGLWDKLPATLQSVIVHKRTFLPKRYSASGVLTNENACGWKDVGKLWIPSETEVAGAPIWGFGTYNSAGFMQYPIFANNSNRVKGLGDSAGARSVWWCLSTSANSNSHFVIINYGGNINFGSASSSYSVPICFRIA